MLIRDHTYRDLLEKYTPWVLVASWSAVLIWGALQVCQGNYANRSFGDAATYEYFARSAFLPLVGALLLTRKLRAAYIIVYIPIFILAVQVILGSILFLVDSSSFRESPEERNFIIFSSFAVCLHLVIHFMYDENKLTDIVISSKIYNYLYYFCMAFWASILISVLVGVYVAFGPSYLVMLLYLTLLIAPFALIILALPFLFIHLTAIGREGARWGLAVLVIILSPSAFIFEKLVEAPDNLLQVAWTICSLIAFASHLLLLMAEPPPPPVIFVARPKSGDSYP